MRLQVTGPEPETRALEELGRDLSRQWRRWGGCRRGGGFKGEAGGRGDSEAGAGRSSLLGQLLWANCSGQLL